MCPHAVDGSGMKTVYDLVTDCEVGDQHIPQHLLTEVNSQHTQQLLASICCLT